MTSVVLDASVAAAWFLPDKLSAVAEQLFEGERPLLAPDLLATEVGNAIFTKTRQGVAPAGHARMAPRALRSHGQIIWFAVPPLLEDAASIAEDKRHPICDCVYLVLARQQSAALATFDKRLSEIARSLAIPLWAAERAG